jgi:hypothetical protein
VTSRVLRVGRIGHQVERSLDSIPQKRILYLLCLACTITSNPTQAQLPLIEALDDLPVPAVITEQPRSYTAPIGGGISFQIGFSPNGPVAFQWKHDGSAIPGNYWILSLHNLQISDAGIYTVTISNSFGEVTSSNALLNVVPPVSLREIGSIPLVKPGISLDVSGDYAYVLSSGFLSNGFSVFNIRPPSPTFLGSSVGSAYGTARIVSSGRYVYSVQGQFLTIYDVFDSRQPKNVGNFYSSWDQDDMAVRDGIAYVTTQRGLEISAVPHPSVKLPLSTPGAYSGKSGIAIVEDKAYTIGPQRLEIYDIRDPRRPNILGSASVGGDTIRVSGEYAYVIGTNGLLIFDVSNPISPTLLNSPWGRTPAGMTIDVLWPYAFLGNGSGLAIIDVRDPTLPGAVGSTPSAANAIKVTGNFIYAVGQDFKVFEIVPAIQTPPPKPVQGPLPQTARIGGTALFGATILGDPPFAYRWRHDGVPLSNATNAFFAITNVQASDFGTYDLTASNAGGTATTVPASLTELIVPKIDPGVIAYHTTAEDELAYTFPSQTGVVYAVETSVSPTGQWSTNHYFIGDGNSLRSTEIQYYGFQKRFFRLRVVE